MATFIKVENPDDPSFPLKIEHESLGSLDEKESQDSGTPPEHGQFETDEPMSQYPDEEKGSDVVESILIDNENDGSYEMTDNNTYIAIDDIDESEQGEQFLTIPRGKTQIAVCDNGQIVYTGNNLIDTVTGHYVEKSDAGEMKVDNETFYYQGQDELIQHMETDEEPGDATEEYVEQIMHGEDGLAVALDQAGEMITFVQEPQSQHQGVAISINSNLVNRGEHKKITSESPRGVKRPILPSISNKNVVTKVFVQNSPTSAGTSNSSIKIIGNVGSVFGGRTLTLADAQRLGLISPNTKIQPVISGTNTTSQPGRMFVKKVLPSGGSSVLAIKQPTKILPAPSPKPRTTIQTARGGVSLTNITPVRSNMSLSQLKTFNALPSAASQVRPVAISRTVGGVTLSKQDPKSPQKLFVRPASNVLSPGQITRLPINASLQPMRMGGKQQLQYIKLISNTSSLANTVLTNVKSKISKPIGTRTVPIAPSPVLPKPAGSVGTNVIGRRLLIQGSGEGDKVPVTMQMKSSIIPLTIKGKAFTTIKSPAVHSDATSRTDGAIVVLPDDDSDKTVSQEELEDGGEKEHLGEEVSDSPSRLLEANGIRPKKPCNCTKSQCLKLYCECFANGEFCFQCNCNNCFNNIEHEEDRQLSIKSCLERNPTAFRPKFQIGDSEEEDRRHKGCNCKRSSCLKNYCECYEAKMMCSKACRCFGCRNNEEGEDMSGRPSDSNELTDDNEASNKSMRFMSPSLAEALCQCIVAQAEAAERKGDDTEATERRIIEEFGQCLVQIIGNRNKRDVR